MPSIFVFDAYGTLFDVHSAIARHRAEAGPEAERMSEIWRTKQQDSSLRTQTLSNEHSPAEFRVIGPTRNQNEWYGAFDVKPGDKYYLAPDQRVHLW